MNTYKVIGLMSGTSLDGLDIAYCSLTPPSTPLRKGSPKERAALKWKYKIIVAETIKYSSHWKAKLDSLTTATAYELALIHSEYGHYIGKQVKRFIDKNKIKADFISSHGHTVFHQPNNRMTFQIGSGAAIAAECSLPVVCDFRTMDVALGGQGAPLVPIGDQLLFPDYDSCLNLGGFANISFEQNKKQVAFDICPVNIILNTLSLKIDQEYDNKGNTARSGKVNTALLKELNNLSYYKKSGNKPKSLGKEWVIENIFPILKKYNLGVNDMLRTFNEHIAIQIKNTFDKKGHKKILVTGGGTYNDFLIETIRAHTSHQLIIPDKKIIDFKEALIFALLGVLRIREEINSLSSVTGASQNSAGGCIYYHKK